MRMTPLMVCAAAVSIAPSVANALTMKECSAKYKASQSAGTLNGMKWNDFRKAECGSDTAAAPASKPTVPSTKTTNQTTTRPTTPPAAPADSAAAGNAIFPTAVSSKYSSESAGKARMHTCLDQYNANKDSGGNGSLKWIQKGGGYYSECNKRLKS